MAANSSTTIRRAHALGLGDVVAAAFKILSARFWTNLGLGVLPMLAAAVLSVASGVVAVLGGLFAVLGSQGSGSTVMWFLVPPLVSGIAVSVLSVRVSALLARLAQDTIDGRRPPMGDLWRSTQGVVWRAWPLIAIVVGTTVVMIRLLSWLTVVVPRPDAGVSAGTLVALGLLGLFAAWIVSAVIYVRLYPLMPVLAFEQHGGIGSVRRALSLTRGNFFRILGYRIVAFAIISAFLFIICLLLTIPFGAGWELVDRSETGELSLTWAAVAAFGIGSAIYTVGLALIFVFSVGYQTVCYTDLTQREAFGVSGAVAR